MVGNRCSQNSSPRWVASSHMCGWPVSCMRRVIALATTSRGARSASSWTPCMNRLPSKSTRNAPSPRTASEISGCWPRESGPRYITVGWNCTNSRSRTVAPARSAIAVPSPVATAGLVVCEKTWPRPPLASTTARQCTAPTPSFWPSPITCRVRPATAPFVVEQQVDGQRVLDHLDLGRGLDGGVEGPLDLGAGGVAAGVRDAVAVVAALAGQADLAGGVVVEVGAERDQLADGGGAVGDQDAYGLLVAGARAGHEGVALVLLGGVAGAERGGDAALRPLGRAGVEDVLGDDEDPADLVLEPQRRGQAGDAGADDHDVARGRPARCGGQQSAGKHVGEASGGPTRWLHGGILPCVWPVPPACRPANCTGLRRRGAENERQVVDEAGGADPGRDDGAGLGARRAGRRAARPGPGR